MINSVKIEFKLNSVATQEQLAIIREDINSFFGNISLKPQEVICRQGSVEIVIIFSAAALYVADKIASGALEEIGKIFVSWIKEKFGKNTKTGIPLDDNNLKEIEQGVQEVIEQSKDGLVALPELTQRPKIDPNFDLSLLDSRLKNDGTAKFSVEMVTKHVDGSEDASTSGIAITKVSGKITEIQRFTSESHKPSN